MKKKEQLSNLDEFLEDLRKKNVDSLDDAFSHYDKHMDKDNQKFLLTEVFGAGMDDFYDSLVKGLKDNVGDDTTKLNENKDGVKKAVLEGLKAYLKRVRPSALDAIKDVDDELEQYKILSHHVDLYLPFIVQKDGKPVSIEVWVDSILKDKSKKVNDLKAHFYNTKSQIANTHVEAFNGQYEETLFGTYHKHEIVAHIKPKVEERYSIEDKVKFTNMEKGQALKLHRHLKHGEEMGEASQYGLEVPEENK